MIPGKHVFIWMVIVAISFFSHETSGQTTPEELGKIVFNVFKNTDTKTLDTLTPTYREAMEVYSKIDSTLDFLKDEDLERKYQYHDSLFKKKCNVIMHDTSYFHINWNAITLVSVEHTQKNFNTKGTYPNSTSLNIHYLEIIFSSSDITYSLFFKGLYTINGIWKLGENMRIRKVE